MKIMLISFCFIFLLSKQVKAQLDFTLSIELLKALKEHQEGYDQLNKLTSIVKRIQEKGEKPADSELENNWGDLAKSYREAKEDINQAKLPTDFPAHAYRLSSEQLSNCFSRDANLTILSKYYNALNNAVGKGKLELDKIKIAKTEVANSFIALNYLIDGYKDFSALPIYGSIFTSDLFALLNTVKPELGEYSAALNKYEKKLVTEVAAAELHKNNLNSNINTMQGSYCLLQGTYKGESPTSANFSWRHQLELVKAGNSYGGKFIMVKSNGTGRRESNISNFSVSGNNIRFSCTWGNYSGTVNSSFSSITMRDPYSATFVMTR